LRAADADELDPQRGPGNAAETVAQRAADDRAGRSGFAENLNTKGDGQRLFLVVGPAV
jgi:hypothetical protein